MEKSLMLLQVFLAGVIAWLSDRLGILFPMLRVLCALMIADYFTGMAASKTEAIDHPGDPAYGWNSAKGAKGILKKFGYLCVTAAGIVLDYVVMVATEHLGFEIRRSVFFGLLVTAWYILNELLSITENAGRMGAPVPKWLVKYIAVLKSKIDDKGSEE